MDISTVDPEVLLTDYAMVFQDVVLFDDTVIEAPSPGLKVFGGFFISGTFYDDEPAGRIA